MVLSPVGEIIRNFWLEIPKHFNNAILDEFIIMPNHVHGIIEINYNIGLTRRDEAMPRLYDGNSVAINTDEALPRLYDGKYPRMSKISPKLKSLPVIIGSFKSISSKIIRKKFSDINFSWQERYYDRIIRNENELNKIRQYIIDNPLKWALDRDNMENLYM